MNPVNEIRNYTRFSGESPFESWLEELRDRKARTIIKARLLRLTYGLAGKCEPVGEGVFELKVYYGPGYRIYFGREHQTLIILLCGGDKRTQSKDIEMAKFYWRDYQQGGKR